MAPIRIIRADQLPQVLDLLEIMASQAAVFHSIAQKTVTMPQRTVFPVANLGNSFVMPAHVPAPSPPSSSPSAPGSLGLKFIGMRSANKDVNLKVIQGCVIVANETTHQIVGLVDAADLTAWRTAAGSALATHLLAPPTPTTLLIFGSGAQSRTHAIYMLLVRPTLTHVTLVSTNASTAERLRQEVMEAHPGVQVEVVSDSDRDRLERVVSGADIICTCTSSSTPLFDGRWVKPHCHINAIGSYQLHTRELEKSTVDRCSLVAIDAEHDSRAEAGDLVDADWSKVVEVGSLVDLRGVADAGGLEGWRRDEGAVGWKTQMEGEANGKDLTLFKSVGVGAQDVAAAAALLRVAELKGIGTVVEL